MILPELVNRWAGFQHQQRLCHSLSLVRFLLIRSKQSESFDSPHYQVEAVTLCVQALLIRYFYLTQLNKLYSQGHSFIDVCVCVCLLERVWR